MEKQLHTLQHDAFSFQQQEQLEMVIQSNLQIEENIQQLKVSQDEIINKNLNIQN